MPSIKGFYSMPALANNGPDGVISQFGEMSTYAKTFTRDEKNYSKPDRYPGVELITTKAEQDAGGSLTLPDGIVNILLSLGNWMYNQHVAGNIPVNINKNLFMQAIMAEHPQITKLVVGEIINGTNVGRNMPDYISFTLIENAINYDFKIWFSDSKFRTQYDEYTILIIPPVNNINDLDAPSSTVGTLLNNVQPHTVVNQISTLTGKFPPTKISTQQLTWHDPNNVGVTISTNWYLISYGEGGTDLDAIKNAIRDYIASVSSKENWNKIYPELYSENEFVIVPMWDNISQPENAANTDLFASYANIGDMSTILRTRVPAGYAQMTNINNFINSYGYIFASEYRTLMSLIIGNPSNAGGVYSIKQLYPDYMSLNTTSPDFIRMEETTREWVIKINEALEIARTMLPSDALPASYTRVIRGSRIYLTFELHGFFYLILTKDSYPI